MKMRAAIRFIIGFVFFVPFVVNTSSLAQEKLTVS